MLTSLKERVWSPPAETKIPWSALLSAFIKQSGRFRVELCNYMNVDSCILGESARALLFKLVKRFDLSDRCGRNEVLIPGYTCYSVAAAIAKANLKISLYDLDPETLQPDLNSLEKAISEKTLAIIVQHLFGIVTPMEEIKSIARKYGVFLIEDAAQAFGQVGNILPGSMGDFGLLSFGRGKPLPLGGGGALISSTHPEIIKSIQLDAATKGYKKVAISAVTQIASKPAFYWVLETLPLGLGQTIFDPDFSTKGMPGTLERMAANALKMLDQLNAHRRDIAFLYQKNLHPDNLVKILGDDIPAYPRFPLLAKKGPVPLDLKRLGVRRLYPNALYEESNIVPYLKISKKKLSGAETLARRLISLPTHHSINKKSVEKIIYKLNQWIN